MRSRILAKISMFILICYKVSELPLKTDIIEELTELSFVVLAYNELECTHVICVTNNQKASKYISAPVLDTKLRAIDLFEASYPCLRGQV